jgi:hypothetical protein
MVQNESFRLLLADRVQKHLFNDGPLSNEKLLARFDAQTARVEDALIADQARWSDDTRRNLDKGRTFTKSDWEEHVQFIRSLIDGEGVTNVEVFIDAFRTAGLLPQIDAPVFNQHGGEVFAGFSLTMTSSAEAAIWLTTDGSDPRLPDGSVNPTATSYEGPIALVADTLVKARARTDDEWSALSEALWHQNLRLAGDANVDGVVDGFDFNIWNANSFRTDALWAHGDFNADGLVDGSDFNIWNDNRFFRQPALTYRQAEDVNGKRLPRAPLGITATPTVAFDRLALTALDADLSAISCRSCEPISEHSELEMVARRGVIATKTQSARQLARFASDLGRSRVLDDIFAELTAKNAAPWRPHCIDGRWWDDLDYCCR